MMPRFSQICLLFLLALSTLIGAPQAKAQSRSTELFRSFGLLGPGASVNNARVAKPQGTPGQNRVVAGSQNLTGPIQFKFVGFTNAQRDVLQRFVNANYNRMVSIYGAPAPEQAGQTVEVRSSTDTDTAIYVPGLAGSTKGNFINFGYNSAKTNEVNTYRFTSLALIAFQGPRIPAFDFIEGNYVEPWLYGLADAGALQVAYLAQGSPANFNPSLLDSYLLPVYDFFNRPELGNAYIYPRPDPETGVAPKQLAIANFRRSMAQSAFLKCLVENPNFLAQFNARLYARGTARTAISPAELQGLAASVVPTVEGRSFGDWARAQYVLDSTVTTGQKLYLAVLPSPSAVAGDTRPGFRVFAQAFTTRSDGDETGSTGLGSLAVFDETGRDVSDLSDELAMDNVLNFGTLSELPGDAASEVAFRSLGTPDRALLTVKARFKSAEAINYFPAGAVGNVNSASSYYGGIIGGQNGVLQLGGSASQNVNVARGTWRATAPYPSGPSVKTTFTFGGVTVRRNTAWVRGIGIELSSAFLLRLPSDLQTLNFVAPAGQSEIRMISLPGFPVKTDEAAALNIAPNALDLARYRPRLAAATTNAEGALVFGIGDRYELYPNISAPLTPGRGYWLGVGEQGYRTQVQASLPPADRDYEVPLEGGWNQIGVPFNRAFNAASIRVRNGGFAPVSLATAQTRGWVAPGIWRWRPEGGYVRADVGDAQLAPFEGYFIFTGLERGVALVFEPSAGASSSNARTKAASGWSLSLHALGAETEDIAGRFGVSDAPNIAKPPAGARVVSLRFVGPDAQGAQGASAAGSGLAESYVAEIGEENTAQWSAIVDGTTPGETVTLEWGKFDGAMRGVRLTLLDSATGKAVAMKSGGQFEFVAGQTPRRLIITATVGGADVSVAPTLAPAPARTADVLTALPNASGFAPDAKIAYSYVWRNGRRVLKNTAATLDLSEPANGERGDTISVEVTARDEQGNAASGTAAVRVVNSEPLVADGKLRVQTGASGSVELFSSDADGDELRLYRSNSPARGTASVRREGGVWKLFYTSFKGVTGADKVEIIAFDDHGGRSKAATIQIVVEPDAPANGAPVAFDGAVDSARGGVATEILLGTDPDGDALSFRLVRGTKFGSSEVILDPADGKWKLRTRNFHRADGGVDSAQFVAVDGAGLQSKVATIEIRFHNRAPVANEASARVVSGVEVAIPVGGSDADGGALSFKRVGGPRNGTGELRRDSDGVWKMFYRSRAGWTGVENVRYVAIDDEGKPSAPATIAISVTASNSSRGASASGASAGSS